MICRRKLNSLRDQILSPLKNLNQKKLSQSRGLMIIDLPVHEHSGCQEIFNGINSFGVNHQFSFFTHIHHRNDALGINIPFGNTGKETVSFKIIKPIHIQLGRNQLVEKFPVVFSLEHFNSH